MPCGGEPVLFAHGEEIPPPESPNSHGLVSVEPLNHPTVGPFDKKTPLRKTAPPMKDDNIVISGISGRFPDCDSIAEFWDKLVSGVELSSVDDRRWPVGYLSLPKRSGKIRDISKCDYEFFGLTEHEANYMDVQMRLALETTYEAIADAGIDPADLRGTKTGIFAGICYDDTGTAFGQDEQTALHYLRFSVQRIAAAFDFRGGASSTDTACASSFSAFYQAYYSLKAGLCDHAVVVGAAVNLRPTIALGFNNLRMTSQDGRSKCMDASADGYGRSEAVVSIFLQRDSNAKRIYSQILNVQTNTDGFKAEGITYPSIESQHRLMRTTQLMTGIHPHEMKYIEAHMTGTPAGDVVESESIRRTFCDGRKDPLLLGCLKSNLGHTEGASGASAISKVCLAFEHKELPPNLNFKNPNLNIEGLKTGALKPVTERMAFHETIVGVSSFGFGGCNVYSILKANEKEPAVDSFVTAFNHSIPRLVAACGRTKEAVESVFSYVSQNKELVTNEFFALLSDAMKTDVSQGMMYRGYSLFEGKNVSKIITRCKPEAQPVWLALSGVCTKWQQLSRSLMNLEPFAKSIIQSHVIALNMGLDLQDILFDKAEGTLRLHEAMTGITATQIALIDVLSEIDLKIDGIIGHSIGEIACAYADGCMSREQAMWTSQLVARQLMNSSTRNGMTGLEWDEIGVHTEKVKGLYSSIRDELSAAVFNTKPKMRSSRWISTSVTSETFDVDQSMSGTYFANAITTKSNLKNMLYLMPKNAVVLEISSQPILEPTLRRGLGPDVTFLAMLQPASQRDPLTHLLSTIGSLYAAGNNLSIERLYPKVEYPVPRGTLPISPLIKWDHNKSCIVTRYPEYFSVIRGVASYDIDLIQSAFQYLSGHVIDGRNLCPAVEYLRFVWEVVVANLFGSRDYMRYPIEFRKVRLMRGILLSRNKSIEVTVKYERETGAFETMEGGNLCCSGYAFLAADPSTQSLEDLVKPDRKEDAVTLDHKSIYKELRVRGYDYGQTFQGLQEASSDGSHGKVKWMGHWVSFVDSMLQIAIMGSNERVLRIPTYIEYVKCNSQIFMENIERCKDEMGESVVDVHFDKTVGVGASKGIVIMGLKTSAIARRNVQQPVLESYHFVPNRDTGIKIMSPSLESYVHECSFVAELLRCKQSNADLSLDDLSEGEKALMQSIRSRVEMKSANVSLLATLHETLASCLAPADEPLSVSHNLATQLHAQSHCLANDMTCVAAMESEMMTRHQIDLVIENSTRDMKVLELNLTTGLLADRVTDLLDANLIQTTYDVLHTEPDPALMGKGPARLTDWSKLLEKSVIIPNDFFDQDLVIMRDDSLQPLPRTSRLSSQDVLNASFKVMKPNAFFIYFGRTNMTHLEQDVMDLLGTDAAENMKDPESLSEQAKEAGFEVVALKSEKCMNSFSLLLRKPVDQMAIKVIPISGSNYMWIDEVKAFLLPQTGDKKSEEDVKRKQQEKKEQLAKSRLWLTSDDPSSGLIGLVNCLRREPGCESVRCFASSTGTGEIPDEVLRLDLVMNIMQESSMGTYRHTLMHSLEVVQKSSHAYVDIKTKGDLSSFRWLENGTKHFDVTPQSCRTSPYELLVKVNYAALNFKDVMIASGRISSDAYPSGLGISGAMLGMEFSGHDHNGNRVMGYTIGKGMATEVSVLDPLFLWPVPEHWTLEEAATVPVVYATVYYGLMVRAGLKRGESVLIHSGAGGVGQAAINVCQSMGCQILTTCSDEKRSFLKKAFGLEDWQIANSRNISFEEHILRVTNGRGVDVVLNSLSETKLKASVNCLAEYGRFVEIGKYDIVVNNLMDMSQFGQNKAFQTTCLAHLDVDAFFNKNPASVNARNRVYDMMLRGIREGVVRPLQSHVYEKEHVEEAFRFMASGKHIGKVLIRIADEEMREEVTVPTVQQTLFHPNKSYIVTGGLGGFGLELMYWMVSRGAKNIILTSRQGIKDNYQKVFLDRMREEAFGTRVLISTNDVSTRLGTELLLREAADLAPVGGIFNLAMVLKDATLENQSVETFASCCGPKVDGTMLLDEMSRKSCPQLDHFVCFSSVVSGRGNAGQTNYGYANSVMERVCENRKRDGLPGLAIQWGAIGDVGVVAEVLGGNDVVIGGTSVPQRLPSCLEVLDQFMMTDYAVVSSVVKVNMKKTAGVGKGDLLGTVCHILGIRDPSSLDPNSTLSELGMDSLMAIEIKQGLEREYDMVLTTQEIRNMKVKDLREMEATIAENGKAGGEKQKAAVSDRVTSSEVTCLPKGNFVRLNDVDAGKPIFLFPPFEGSFRLMSPICKHVNRPVIGVNWTEEVEKIASFKDMVAYVVHLIRQNYPDSTHDLMGYDFGGLIALETAAQLQNNFGDSACTKLALIESSPDLMKCYSQDFLTRSRLQPDQADETLFNNLLVEYLHMFFALEMSERQELDQELIKLASSKDDKLQVICHLFDKKIAEAAKDQTEATSDDGEESRCQPEQMREAITRFLKKIQFAANFEISRCPLPLTLGLQRSTDSLEVASQLDSTYNLGKYHAQGEEMAIDTLEGDHRTMLMYQAEAIGHSLDSFFVNVFCA